MKKMILTMIIAVLIMPVIGAKAENVEFEIGLVHYTNKSPFTLIGKAAPGTEVSMRGKKVATIGDDGVFKIDLEIKEGDNVFHFKATKDGQSTTKGILVQMRTTAPKVHFCISSKLMTGNQINIKTKDVNEYQQVGFTEPECIIEGDGNKAEQDGIMFTVKLTIEKSPSKTDHIIKITDKYGNISTFILNITNIHEKTCKMQTYNKIATIDGVEFTMPVELTIYRASTMVPLRFFCNTFLGGNVTYSAESKMITVELGGNLLVIYVGNPKGTFNGKEVTINGTPPVIINGSLMVPFRFIGEIFECWVSYDSATRSVTITQLIYP